MFLSSKLQALCLKMRIFLDIHSIGRSGNWYSLVISSNFSYRNMWVKNIECRFHSNKIHTNQRIFINWRLSVSIHYCLLSIYSYSSIIVKSSRRQSDKSMPKIRHPEAVAQSLQSMQSILFPEQLGHRFVGRARQYAMQQPTHEVCQRIRDIGNEAHISWFPYENGVVNICRTFLCAFLRHSGWFGARASFAMFEKITRNVRDNNFIFTRVATNLCMNCENKFNGEYDEYR